MPVLDNLRHEIFAQHRARGELLDDAFEAAGYVSAPGHATRLAKRAAVAERIVELRAAAEELNGAGGQAMVAALLRMAERCDYFDTPERMRETRLTLMDAWRLQKELAEERRAEREALGRLAIASEIRPKRRPRTRRLAVSDAKTCHVDPNAGSSTEPENPEFRIW